MVFQRIAALVGILLTVLAMIGTLWTVRHSIVNPEFAVSSVLGLGFLAFFVVLGSRGARSTATAYW